MKLEEIKKIAKEKGVPVAKKKKFELILDIQEKEGNWPCFGTAEDYCDQYECLWREDCLKK